METIKKYNWFLLGLILLFAQCKEEKKEIEQQSNHLIVNQSPIIPREPNFVGEKLPVQKNYVKEALDLELLKNMYWHSNTFLILKRTRKYFPQIERILKENQMPEDLKFLAVAESNLNPKIISPAGAKGIWQFMPETAREYGLKVNKEIDERSHINKSTRAAIQLLKQLKDSTNSWSLAAASYNAGWGNIKKNMNQQRFQKEKDSYFDLKLYKETERYVYRIVALKSIIQSPESYGFQLSDSDYYSLTTTRDITISESIPNWYDWCRKQGVSYRELIELNPWIVGEGLSLSADESYEIKIPKNEK